MQAWGPCQPYSGPPAASIPTGFAQGHSEIAELLMLQMQAAQFRKESGGEGEKQAEYTAGGGVCLLWTLVIDFCCFSGRCRTTLDSGDALGCFVTVLP